MKLPDDFLPKHDISENGVDMLCWADPNPKVAVINFTSMNPGKYERWSWFTPGSLKTPAVYLFLRDEPQHFYLGSKENPELGERRREKVRSVLTQHGVTPSQAITVGSSMGGYGAVHLGVSLGCNGIVCINPQVDFDSAGKHKFTLWTRKMKEAAWVDLDQFVREYPATPHKPWLRLDYGTYEADRLAAAKLINAWQGRGWPLKVQEINSEDHGWVGMTREQLLQFVNEAVQKLAPTVGR